MHNNNPSLKAYNSAAMLEASPIGTPKLATHCPYQFLTSPPPPANLVLLITEPYVFNLNQVTTGFTHLIALRDCSLKAAGSATQYMNSLTCISTHFRRFGFGACCLNTLRFLWSQRFQKPKRKKVLR